MRRGSWSAAARAVASNTTRAHGLLVFSGADVGATMGLRGAGTHARTAVTPSQRAGMHPTQKLVTAIRLSACICALNSSASCTGTTGTVANLLVQLCRGTADGASFCRRPFCDCANAQEHRTNTLSVIERCSSVHSVFPSTFLDE
ncbi:hypothetical protein BC628DRAFT_74649 [Trametes gibbosa]|nr:hypothetical protein BC628DRAFT_74649 [Trametes gibbosa]